MESLAQMHNLPAVSCYIPQPLFPILGKGFSMRAFDSCKKFIKSDITNNDFFMAIQMHFELLITIFQTSR